MSALEKYCLAVANRKSRDTHGTVNVAIVAQLEDNDIPRLLEMVRIADQALRETDITDYSGHARQTYKRIEELAAAGSSAKWGDATPVASSMPPFKRD